MKFRILFGDSTNFKLYPMSSYGLRGQHSKWVSHPHSSLLAPPQISSGSFTYTHTQYQITCLSQLKMNPSISCMQIAMSSSCSHYPATWNNTVLNHRIPRNTQQLKHKPSEQFSNNSSWYTLSGSNEPLPVLSSSRVRLLGPILAIEAVTSEDAGTYKCAVANAGGEANAELRLTVSTPLHVEIMPNVLSVNMGATAEFRCVVSSNGMPMVSHHHITWIKVSISHWLWQYQAHALLWGMEECFYCCWFTALSFLLSFGIPQDGRQLPMSGQMGNTLLVTGVGREDKGMYQCMVRRQEGDTFQAVAELQLGGKWAQDVGSVYVNLPEILN